MESTSESQEGTAPPSGKWADSFRREAAGLREGTASAEEALEGVVVLAVTMLEAADQQMAEALASRDIIGQAKGILMERCHMAADDAFEALKRVSQRRHVKVRELAEHVAASVAARDTSLDEELCGSGGSDG